MIDTNFVAYFVIILQFAATYIINTQYLLILALLIQMLMVPNDSYLFEFSSLHFFLFASDLKLTSCKVAFTICILSALQIIYS